MKILLALLSVLAFVNSCAKDENKVEDINTKMTVKGQTDNGSLGVDDAGKAVVQDSIDADMELRRQQWVNNKLEEELSSEHYLLKRCREDVADPRLGGTGKVIDIPDIDKMKTVTEVKEKFGLDEKGNLKVVKRSYFVERLKNARKYENTLRDMIKLVTKYKEQCERKMGYARTKAGLPAKRYKAKGYFTGNGTWVETQQAENSLDDAFEISAKAKAKNSQ